MTNQIRIFYSFVLEPKKFLLISFWSGFSRMFLFYVFSWLVEKYKNVTYAVLIQISWMFLCMFLLIILRLKNCVFYTCEFDIVYFTSPIKMMIIENFSKTRIYNCIRLTEIKQKDKTIGMHNNFSEITLWLEIILCSPYSWLESHSHMIKLWSAVAPNWHVRFCCWNTHYLWRDR